MKFVKRCLIAEAGWISALIILLWSCVHYGQFPHTGQDRCYSRTRAYTAGSAGDDDVYCFGILLGIYLQWLSSPTSTIYLVRQRTRLTAAYISFQIAVLAAFQAMMYRDTCVSLWKPLLWSTSSSEALHA